MFPGLHSEEWMLGTPSLDPGLGAEERAGVRVTQLWSSRQGRELYQHLQFLPSDWVLCLSSHSQSRSLL